MRSLSIRQPYAEAILREVKTIDYRTRATNVRGRIYVYASLGRYAEDDEVEVMDTCGITDMTCDWRRAFSSAPSSFTTATKGTGICEIRSD